MLKIEKFTDVCMTGGIHCTPSHTNVCKFYNFQLTFSHTAPEMLKLGRVSKVKMLILVLVFVFKFDFFKISTTILEKGRLFDRNREPS